MARDFSDFKFFHYDPSLAAAVIFVVLFSATTVLHGYQMFRHRAWFMTPLLIGGCFEFIGYIGRAISSQQSPDWTLGPYIINSILVLVAPALFAASIYMLLGRIILVTRGERYSIIKRKWLTKIFVTGDVLSFLMQSSVGGIMSGKTASKIELGETLVVAGLATQVVFFGFFVVVAAIFHVRITKAAGAHSPGGVSWARHLYVLYAASVLILIRSVFRIVEYRQGNDGYLLGHEVFLYVFDAVLMFLVMILLNAIHPGEISAALRRENGVGNGSELSSFSNVDENAKQGQHRSDVTA